MNGLGVLKGGGILAIKIKRTHQETTGPNAVQIRSWASSLRPSSNNEPKPVSLVVTVRDGLV